MGSFSRASTAVRLNLNIMSLKKLTDLSSCELSTELKTAGIVVTGNNFNDRESILRLSTHLIDKGEDPTSYEFKVNECKDESLDKCKKEDDEKGLKARQSLLAKIVRLERSYFTK